MKILIINSGSSSIKFQLLDMTDTSVLANGLIERIGQPLGSGDNVSCKYYPGTDQKSEVKLTQKVADHRDGILTAIDLLLDKDFGVMAHHNEVVAVGHRIVHGGEKFSHPVIIDDEVIKAIEDVIPLAPLHNPGHLDGIYVAKEIFDTIPHVAVFDTAYYHTMPAHAYIYALPYSLYTEHHIRRYGFHGTSHKFVAEQCAKRIDKDLDTCNLITVHLGNGCSMTAVKDGKAVDTSMGVTPLEGLVMGTRSGNIDPAIIALLHRNTGMSVEEIDYMLNKKSGLKGISQISDMRDIHKAIAAGNKQAKLALEIQTYRIRKYIGSYMAVIGKVDAIVFTAGIGENDDIVRHHSLTGLEHLGVELDTVANNARSSEPFCISTKESKIAVWVIPTNEELAIALQTQELIA